MRITICHRQYNRFSQSWQALGGTVGASVGGGTNFDGRSTCLIAEFARIRPTLENLTHSLNFSGPSAKRPIVPKFHKVKLV